MPVVVGNSFRLTLKMGWWSPLLPQQPVELEEPELFPDVFADTCMVDDRRGVPADVPFAAKAAATLVCSTPYVRVHIYFVDNKICCKSNKSN